MSCEEIRENLIAWLDGELDPAASAGVDRHLESCRECAEELVGMRAIGREVSRVLGPIPRFDTEQALQGLLAVLQREQIDADPGASTDRGRRAPFRYVAGGRERPGSRDGARSGVHPPQPMPMARRGRARRASRWIAAGGLAAVLALAVAVGLDVRERDGGSSLSTAGSGQMPPTAPQAARTERAPLAVTGERHPAQAAIARGAASSRSGGAVVPAAEPVQGGDDDLQVPDEVRRRPGMFLDIPIVQRLDKLRSLEAVYHQSDEGSG